MPDQPHQIGDTGVNDSGTPPIRRSDSQTSLRDLRRQEAARQAQWQRDSNEQDRRRIEGSRPMPAELEPPSYQETEAFPYVGLMDRFLGMVQGKTVVNLSENNIVDTKSYIDLHDDKQATFNELSRRDDSIQQWLNNNEKAVEDTLKSIRIGRNQYDDIMQDLIQKKSKVKDLINRIETNRLQALSLGLQLEPSIKRYKTTFKLVLDIAHNAHHTLNGLPPTFDETSTLVEPPAYE